MNILNLTMNILNLEYGPHQFYPLTKHLYLNKISLSQMKMDLIIFPKGVYQIMIYLEEIKQNICTRGLELL